MNEFKSLRVLDKLSKLFAWWGIDYQQLRQVLQLKLTTIERTKQKNSDYWLLFGYGLPGLLVVSFIFSPMSLFLRLFLIWTIIMFMLLTTIVGDFSLLLLGDRDRELLAGRPISLSVLSLARVLQVIIYLGVIGSILIGPTLLVGMRGYGWQFGLLMLVTGILAVVFLVFAASIAYGLLLKSLNIERLKNIINYFQIGISLSVPIIYYLVQGIFKPVEQTASFVPGWWSFFLPPAWFSGIFELVINNQYDLTYILLSLLAIFMPLAGIVIYLKVISHYFKQDLNNSNVRRNKKQSIKQKVSSWWSKLLASSSQQQPLIWFSWRMLASDRELKLTIYPQLGLAVIIPFVFLQEQIDVTNLSASLEQLTQGVSFLVVYLSFLFLVVIFYRIGQTKHYQGAWLYQVLPIKEADVIYQSALKTILLKYQLPVVACLGLVFLIIYQGKIIIDIAVILVNLVVVVSVLAYFSTVKLPFAYSIETKGNSSTRFASVILSGLTTGVLVFVHFILRSYVDYGLIIYLLAAVGLVKFIWYLGFNCTWTS